MSGIRKSALIFGSLVVAGLMFAPISIAVNRQFWDRLLDAGHLPLFFCYTLLLWWAIKSETYGSVQRIIVAVIIVTAVAGAVEIIQPYFGRTKSFDDFRNGAIGSILAGLAIHFWQTRKGFAWWAGWSCVAIALAAMTLTPAWNQFRSLLWRSENFPTLGDFENPLELNLWETQGGSPESATEIGPSIQQFTHGSQSLRVKTAAGSWAGVTFHAESQDWRGKSALAMDVYNPATPFTLSLRVDDNGDCSKFGQRYDDGFNITNGWNHLSVPIASIENGPKTRKLNLQNIRRLALFTGENQPSREFFLDYVHLE